MFKDVKTIGELKAAIRALQVAGNLDDDTPLATDQHSQYDTEVGIGVFPGFDNGGYISEVFKDTDLVKARAYFYVGAAGSFPRYVPPAPAPKPRQLMLEAWYRNRGFNQ
jgi:hypothetical protein